MKKNIIDQILALFGLVMFVSGMAVVSDIFEREAYSVYQVANVNQLAQSSYWYGNSFEGSSGADMFRKGPELQSPRPVGTTTASSSKPFIKVLSPNGGEIVKQGQTLDINWSSNNISSKVKIDLIKGTTSTPFVIKDSTPDKDSYKWKVPTTIAPSNNYKIRIYDVGNKLIYDDSDRNFSIASSTLIATTTATSTATTTLSILSVSTDPTTPSFSLISGGTADVVAGAYRFNASNDSIILKQLSLKLTQGSPSSVLKVTIWNGINKVGETYFIGNNKVATSTLIGDVLISKGTSKTLVIKADIVDFGVSSPLTRSGEIVKIDYSDAVAVSASNNKEAKVSGSTNVAGFKVMKSYPRFSMDSLPLNGISDGRLLRFKITADNKGDVSVGSFYIGLRSEAGGNIAYENISVRAYVDSAYAITIPGVPSGELASGMSGAGAGGAFLVAKYENGKKVPLFVIPSGQTIYVEVSGRVSAPWYRTLSLTTYLLPDTSGASYEGSPLGNNGNLVWSPNSTTTSSSLTSDWFNGMAVPGSISIMQNRTR